MNAIDLYSGIGGWAVGLKLAGIDVLASYELSPRANETNRRNNRHLVVQADIRLLKMETLPRGVTAIVGSPPCTQFSFSNRGGGGDLSDGLEDIKCFLRIVDRVKPTVWAMENVPRLAKILKEELRPGGVLAEFQHLDIKYEVFDMQDFGVPQKRLRCIVGNFDFKLLRSYRSNLSRRTLGSVVTALGSDPTIDPNFGFSIPAGDVADHWREESLDAEEVRINRSLKALHPIYNAMHFPDGLHRASRTITATCTRVSRESIVIEAPESPGTYRRLTVRERAVCQTFPINFQLNANSYSEKLKMVGNAVPPLFAYFVAHAMRGTPEHELTKPIVQLGDFSDVELSAECRPDRRGVRYRTDRSFQFAVPSLRLGSGIRLELNNNSRSGQIDWHTKFVFGTSKSIQSIQPGNDDAKHILTLLDAEGVQLGSILDDFANELRRLDFAYLQAVWSHRGPGATRPFMLLDMLDDHSKTLLGALAPHKEACIAALKAIANELDNSVAHHLNSKKLSQNATVVIAAFLIGSTANRIIQTASGPPFARTAEAVTRIAV